jgi:alpha-tubulin suppressor-like RCC1 family protein
MKKISIFLLFPVLIASAYAVDPDSLTTITVEKIARTLGTKYHLIAQKDQSADFVAPNYQIADLVAQKDRILDEIFSYNLPEELTEKVISEAIQPQGIFSSHSGETSCTIVNGTVWCWASKLSLFSYREFKADLPHSKIRLYNIFEKTFQDVRSLAVGIVSACALLKNGDVWCGDRSQEMKMESNVVSIYAGFSHYCAIKSDHTVWCWEENRNWSSKRHDGRSRQVTFSNKNLSNKLVKELALGGNDNGDISFGLMEDGTLFRWTDSYEADKLGKFKDACSISASNRNCVILRNHRMKKAMVYKVKPTVIKIVDIVKGSLPLHSALISYLGGMGYLNEESKASFDLPIHESEFGGFEFESFESEDVKSISLGGSHACVLKLDSTIECAGTNDFGQLGHDTESKPSETFGKVQGFSESLEAQIQRSLTRLYSQGKIVHFHNRPTAEDIHTAASYFEHLGNYTRAANIFKEYLPNDLYRLRLEIKAIGQRQLSDD